jgi:acyl carrier protein
VKDQHDSFLEKVRAIVTGLAPGTHIDDDTPLIADRIVDSLSLLSLVMQLQDGFAIEIRDADLRPENFASIKAICAFAEARLL